MNIKIHPTEDRVMRTQAPVVRQKLVPLQNLPSARGCKFPFVICNEEKEGRREERVAPPRRGESP